MDQIEEEDIYGFKVQHNTGSMLRITRGEYDIFGEDYALMNLSIVFAFKGTDYEKQLEEVEEILSQQVEENTVRL
ncbi:hypothetical protein [Paenibacillus ihumii]|uniref:hypothetical protein n=1 Tax=Paenibacillus ihumii TaxID=687436 RepID=UPI0006D76F3F|nr:hypothetical protein [Paenibacillus ihumii]